MPFFRHIPAALNLPLALLTVGFTLGYSSTALTADPEPADESTTQLASPHHNHGASNHDHDAGNQSGHHHGSIEIPDGQPVPSITLVVHPDSARGWNLEIQTTHFRFAPEQVNQANQPNTGHGHLYINGDINGERNGRVYGPWLHLPQLSPGRNEITVSLNANGHEALTHNGQAIESTVVIEVSDAPSASYSPDS